MYLLESDILTRSVVEPPVSRLIRYPPAEDVLIARDCCAERVTPASIWKVNGSSLSIVTERPGEVMVWGVAKRLEGL